MKRFITLFFLLIFLSIVTEAAEKMSKYVVQEGDSLYQIAKAHHITVEQLKKDNNITEDQSLKVGTLLKIQAPKKTTYKISDIVFQKKDQKNRQNKRLGAKSTKKEQIAFIMNVRKCFKKPLDDIDRKQWEALGINPIEASIWNCAGVDVHKAKELKERGVDRPILIFKFQRDNGFELPEAIDLVEIGVSSSYALKRWMNSYYNHYSHQDVIQWKNQIKENRINAQTYAGIKMYSTVYENPQFKINSTNDGIHSSTFAGLSCKIQTEPKVFGPIVKITLNGKADRKKAQKLLSAISSKYQLLDEEETKKTTPPSTGYQKLARMGYSDRQIYDLCRMGGGCDSLLPEVVTTTTEYTFKNNRQKAGDLIIVTTKKKSDEGYIRIDIEYVSKLLVDRETTKKRLQEEKKRMQKKKEESEMNFL